MCQKAHLFNQSVYMIRLLKLTIDNLMAIGHGELSMPCMLNHFASETTDIVGIYGQNGSGKTCVVEALSILQLLWTGQCLNGAESASILRHGEQRIRLAARLQYWDEPHEYTLYYEVEFERDVSQDHIEKREAGLKILRETLQSKEVGKAHAKKNVLISCDVSHGFKDVHAVRNAALYKKLNAHYEGNLDIFLAQIAQSKSSYIFCTEQLRALSLTSPKEGRFVSALNQYATHHLCIVGRSVAGVIACNIAQPLYFYLPKGCIGLLPLSLTDTNLIPKNVYKNVVCLIREINTMLSVLVKDCRLSLECLGDELNEHNVHCVRCKLMSHHGSFCAPLSRESEGIKRLVSLLHLLIAVYNNDDITVVIDELDAGIYEFLLGELLHVLNLSAKGQLIFTAHNLRPLEMLRASSILLTTNCPNNRLAKFPRSRIKARTNMRNMYMRAVQLGDHDLNVELDTPLAALSRSFRYAAGTHPEYA